MSDSPIFSFNNPAGGGSLGGGGSAGTPAGGGTSTPSPSGNTPPPSTLTAQQLLAFDISENRTPIVPAGAYNVGNGKVYTAFTTDDVVEGGNQRITRGLWSGNVGELTTFFTSSFQSATQKQYYYEIYNGNPALSTSEAQFSVAYGHRLGSGSLDAGVDGDAPSKAIYGQYQQTLLPSTQTQFTFGTTNSNDIYAITINRARLKDKLDRGNWELCLSGSLTGKFVRLIDDSGDVNQNSSNDAESYNVVSGSLANGVFSTTQIFGTVYPHRGVIILNPAALDASASLGTVRTNSDAQNHNKLFLAISGAAAANSSNGFQARNEEEVKSTFFFTRVKNAEYNFSNNPSYVTGSDGDLGQSTFIGDPKTYITTVGLYNNDNELLAIAKLSKPILKSFSNEVLVKVKLDF
jgi:hypothetical protein